MAGIYTQRRVIPHAGSTPNWTKTDKLGNVIKSGGERIYACSQVTTSFRTGKGESLVSPGELRDSNKNLNNLLKTQKVVYDIGHAFDTVKKSAFVNIPMFSYVQKSTGSVYYAPITHTSMVNVTDSSYPTIPKWASVNSDGNKAISETYPTKPGMSLSQSIVELKREGLPSLFGSQIASMKGSAARAIGSEFLNSVFGWTPLIADLDYLLKAVVSSSKTVQQMRRDSGKVVRRKHHFPPINETISSSTLVTSSQRIMDSGHVVVSGYLTIEETRTTQSWFSGAYTYFLDPGDNLVGKAIEYEQLANKLLGTRLTPALLWELAPWSWLADWYANIGENIEVASAFQSDGLVLKYGYIMRKVIARKMYTFTPNPSLLVEASPSRLVLQTTSKERVKSSPFGFGLNTDDLNDRQWAILGSLGLTKAPRSLR